MATVDASTLWGCAIHYWFQTKIAFFSGVAPMYVVYLVYVVVYGTYNVSMLLSTARTKHSTRYTRQTTARRTREELTWESLPGDHSGCVVVQEEIDHSENGAVGGEGVADLVGAPKEEGEEHGPVESRTLLGGEVGLHLADHLG